MDELLHDIDEYLDGNWEDMLGQLDALVRIPSVEDLANADPDAGRPWGPQPARALEAALALAQDMGFAAVNMDGRIGYADFAGETDTQIGIIGHMDVVDAGPGWTVEPFACTRRDGYVLGRGVTDDKGPSLMALHAMRFWLERQRVGKAERFPYTVRFIFGANEETGMGDVPYYQERFEDPAFLFTPDSHFPVCYGEKGMFGAQLVSASLPAGERTLLDYIGGTSSNAVPGTAFAVVRADVAAAASLPAADGIAVEVQPDGMLRIEAAGKSAHASTPEEGVNANMLLLGYLLDNGLCSDAERSFLELAFTVAAHHDGSGVGIACSDEHFGPLTCVGSVLRYEGEALVLDVDVRYPTSTDGASILQALDTAAQQAGASVRLVVDKPVFFNDPDSPVIQALLSAYNEVTGEQREAYTMGGGTYARKFKCAACFGAEKLWEPKPDWVGSMHGPDEGISEEQLKDAFRIYALTLGKLMELEL